jgi:hypothetical protein
MAVAKKDVLERECEHGQLPCAASAAGRWYFCVGPLVNPAVRDRRRLNSTDHHQAAVLLDYRLIFTHSGAHVVPKIGYNVHGVVMRVPHDDDWQRIVDVDSGAWQQIPVNVYPYGTKKNHHSHHQHQKQKHQSSHDDDAPLEPDTNDDDDAVEDDDIVAAVCKGRRPIHAYVSIINEYDESQHGEPLEKKPQERYLRLIAEGMRHHGVDETYVTDEVMSCPFVPKRTPEDWYTFPTTFAATTATQLHRKKSCNDDKNAQSSNSEQDHQQQQLPVITMKKYEKLCRKNKKPNSDVYFILHNYVLKMGTHDPQNPIALWIRGLGHGKADLCYTVHQIVVDPDIPWARTRGDMTLLHYAWAEDHVFEVFKLCGTTATKLFCLEEQNTATTTGRTSNSSNSSSLFTSLSSSFSLSSSGNITPVAGAAGDDDHGDDRRGRNGPSSGMIRRIRNSFTMSSSRASSKQKSR